MSSVLLDTNLLLLYVVGSHSEQTILKHKRLSAYSIDSFVLLSAFVEQYNGIVVTPHVVAETSSLLRLCKEPMRSEISETFRLSLMGWRETFIPSIGTTSDIDFARLGVTDCIMMLEEVADDSILLTSDLDLYLTAIRRGQEAVNFNHLREEYGV